MRITLEHHAIIVVLLMVTGRLGLLTTNATSTKQPQLSTNEPQASPPDFIYDPYDFTYDYTDYKEYFNNKNQIDSSECQRSTECRKDFPFPSTTCYCDKMCSVLRDCCANYPNNTTFGITPSKGQFECVQVKEIILTAGFGVHMVTKCSNTWEDQATRDLCENKTDTDDISLKIPVSDDSSLKLMYKNMYCAQCNYVDDIYYWEAHVKCKNETGVRFFPGSDECSLLFDQPKPEMKRRMCLLDIISRCDDVRYHTACEDGQFSLVYDSNGQAYRNKYCAHCHGELDNLFCVSPVVATDNGTSPTPLDPRSGYTYRYLVDINAGTVEDKITKATTNTSCDIHNEIYDIWTNKCRQIHCAPSFVLENKRCVRKLYFTSNTEYANETVNCTLIKLEAHEYEMRNSSTLFMPSQNKVYTEGEFHTNGTDVFICSDRIPPCTEHCYETFVNFDLDPIESIMSLVGMILSLVSLTITLIVYVAFPQLLNIPGKILICLIISLAVAQLCFLVAPLVDHISSCCILVAVLVHYFFLCAFCWMNVIAVDLWMTFSNKFMNPGSGSSRSKRFMFYSLYGWLVPMIIVLVAVVVNFIELDSTYDDIKPLYGRNICWITTKYGLILYFVGPLAVFKIIDIVSFIVTSIQIARAKRDGAMASQKNNTCSLLINIKLSLVMGLTWVFAYIALLTNWTAMWYMFIIFNTLQGLFIAISFLCTKKVGRLMYAKYERISTNFTSKTQLTSTG